MAAASFPPVGGRVEFVHADEPPLEFCRAFSGLLDALIRQRRLAGVECAERGHDLASKALASGWEVGDRLVVSLGAVCRACEKPVTVNESMPLLSDPVLDERASREALKDLTKKLRAMDRNRKDRP